MGEATEETELAALGERIASHAVQLDLITHRLLVDLRRFDEAGGWHAQGFSSCAHWLSFRVGWDLATSRERVRVAKALGALPQVNSALASGQLSYCKARAITRVATPKNEETLLKYAEVCTGGQLETICRKYRAIEHNPADPDAPLPRSDERYVSASPFVSGMICVKAVLRCDEAALLMEAVQAATRRCRAESASDDEPPARFNRADGLMAIIQTYARGDSPQRSPVEMIITTPAEVLRGKGPSDEGAWRLGSAAERPGSAPMNEQDGGSNGLCADPLELGGAAEREAGGDACSADAPRRGDVVERGVHRDQVSAEMLGLGEAAQRDAGGHELSAEMVERTSSPAEVPSRTDTSQSPSALRLEGEDRGAIIPVAIVASTDIYLDPEVARRLACDCGVVEATVDRRGEPLSIGRKSRTLPASIKRALLLRDRTCRFPGCEHRLFLDGHHLHHWADGGETSLSNTILLCATHHSYVHERDYRIVRADSGDLIFFDSRGKQVTAVAPRPPVGADHPDVSADGWRAPACGGRLDHREAVARLMNAQRTGL